MCNVFVCLLYVCTFSLNALITLHQYRVIIEFIDGQFSVVFNKTGIFRITILYTLCRTIFSKFLRTVLNKFITYSLVKFYVFFSSFLDPFWDSLEMWEKLASFALIRCSFDVALTWTIAKINVKRKHKICIILLSRVYLTKASEKKSIEISEIGSRAYASDLRGNTQIEYKIFWSPRLFDNTHSFSSIWIECKREKLVRVPNQEILEHTVTKWWRQTISIKLPQRKKIHNAEA